MSLPKETPINKISKDSIEFASYLILMAKGLKKYGFNHIKQSIIATEENTRSIFRNHIFRYIIDVVTNEYGVTEEDIKSKDQRGINIEARDYVILLAKNNLSISNAQLAIEMERNRQLIHLVCKNFNNLSRENNIDKPFFEKYDKLNSKIEIYIHNLKNGL